ncbi:hypothetical protein BU16DRAFT_317386 [Lophium mytilinum]|uniref:Uncharacterized protein n=1 Tax=Lophium mytilinum TaxID=390894 RepID=A0A6A6QZ76_9PEZI|nr:hypothetical protein BU16DRAFT_317386 [Lophium mytilinum]
MMQGCLFFDGSAWLFCPPAYITSRPSSLPPSLQAVTGPAALSPLHSPTRLTSPTL